MTTAGPASILHYFEDLPDPRRQTNNKLHLLLDIVVIALSAVIAGCESAVEFAEFGRQKEDWFRKFLRLPNGIPAHDTFSRVFALLDPRKFHECFVRWVNALHEVTQGQVVNIDGKTVRRSFDRAAGIPALTMCSAGIPAARSKERLTVLPSILTTWPWVTSCRAFTQRTKHS